MSQNKTSQITTHVLDTSIGQPALGVPIYLYQQIDGQWEEIGCGITNHDGRVNGLLDQRVLPAGIYRMHFDTKRYFSSKQQNGFYPYVDVVFELDESGSHYHVPLLLSPFGYSTYRGS